MVSSTPGEKQAFLFRAVDIALEIFALTAALLRARAAERAADPNASANAELGGLVATNGRRRIRSLFHELWHNDDAAKYRLAQAALEGRYAWLEHGIMPSDFDVQALRPPEVGQLPAAETASHAEGPVGDAEPPTLRRRPSPREARSRSASPSGQR
jgi:hypothetical protein